MKVHALFFALFSFLTIQAHAAPSTVSAYLCGSPAPSRPSIDLVGVKHVCRARVQGDLANYVLEREAILVYLNDNTIRVWGVRDVITNSPTQVLFKLKFFGFLNARSQVVRANFNLNDSTVALTFDGRGNLKRLAGRTSDNLYFDLRSFIGLMP